MKIRCGIYTTSSLSISLLTNIQVASIMYFVKCIKNHLHSIFIVSNLCRGEVSLRKLCSMLRDHKYQSRIQIQVMLLQRPHVSPFHLQRLKRRVGPSVCWGINMCPKSGLDATTHGAPHPGRHLRTLYIFFEPKFLCHLLNPALTHVEVSFSVFLCL